MGKGKGPGKGKKPRSRGRVGGGPPSGKHAQGPITGRKPRPSGGTPPAGAFGSGSKQEPDDDATTEFKAPNASRVGGSHVEERITGEEPTVLADTSNQDLVKGEPAQAIKLPDDKARLGPGSTKSVPEIVPGPPIKPSPKVASDDLPSVVIPDATPVPPASPVPRLGQKPPALPTKRGPSRPPESLPPTPRAATPEQQKVIHARPATAYRLSELPFVIRDDVVNTIEAQHPALQGLKGDAYIAKAKEILGIPANDAREPTVQISTYFGYELVDPNKIHLNYKPEAVAPPPVPGRQNGRIPSLGDLQPPGQTNNYTSLGDTLRKMSGEFMSRARSFYERFQRPEVASLPELPEGQHTENAREELLRREVEFHKRVSEDLRGSNKVWKGLGLGGLAVGMAAVGVAIGLYLTQKDDIPAGAGVPPQKPSIADAVVDKPSAGVGTLPMVFDGVSTDNLSESEGSIVYNPETDEPAAVPPAAREPIVGPVADSVIPGPEEEVLSPQDEKDLEAMATEEDKCKFGDDEVQRIYEKARSHYDAARTLGGDKKNERYGTALGILGKIGDCPHLMADYLSGVMHNHLGTEHERRMKTADTDDEKDEAGKKARRHYAATVKSYRRAAAAPSRDKKYRNHNLVDESRIKGARARKKLSDFDRVFGRARNAVYKNIRKGNR